MATKYYGKNDQKFDKFVWNDKNGGVEYVTATSHAIHITNAIGDEVSLYQEDIPKLIWALKEAAKEININIEEE